MRSDIKDHAFFLRKVAELEDLQRRSYLKLLNGEIRSDRIINVKRMVFDRHLHLAIAKFSGGWTLGEVAVEYHAALKLLTEVWPDDGSEPSPDYLKDCYVQLLWMLAFDVFLGTSADEYKKIVAVWDQSRRKDWLIEYFIGYHIQSRPQIGTLLFPKPFGSLKKAVEETDPQMQSSIIKHYLEKEWYSGHKGLYWYDNHKSQHDVFFGYWSFEAAAVVKIAGIDDSSFRDNAYYPKDMLG